MRFTLAAACGTHRGRIRKNNEDAIYFNGELPGARYSTINTDAERESISLPTVKQFSTEGAACFGIFDGMGGEEDGQIASYLSAKAFQEDCEVLRAAGEAPSDVFLNRTVVHMNEVVCDEAKKRMNRMGSTAVMLVFHEDAAFLCNVGDSRAFRFRENTLTQMSLDHLEEIPPFMRKSGRAKPHLSQCIGTPPEEMLLEPYLASESVYAGDCYLLCSDGLTDMVSPEEIRGILSQERDAGRCVQQMIDLALEHGGKDNISVVVIYVQSFT